MGTYITKAALLKPQLKVEDVDVAELGGTVRLRELTTGEVDRIRAQSTAKAGEVDMKQGARLLACAIVAEDGTRLLSDDEVDVLMGLPVGVTQRLLTVLNKLNGVSAEAAAAAEKN